MSISVDKKNIERYIKEICHRSPRYAGTEGEVKTREYIVSESKKLGLSVELDEFEYLHYWPISSKLETLMPIESTLEHLPLCYAGSGVAEGEAIYAGSGTQEEFELLDKQGVDIKGKIVLAGTIGTYRTYPLAQQYGASGVVILTDAPGNLCRAGTATADREAGKIPGVLVPVSIGKRLLTLMSTGRLKLRVTSNGEFSKKTSANIIITVPGTTLPNEQVVLPAHYDSHNLGKHAWDNASGCAALLELTRIYNKLKPNRTIKAIFCGVEEIGFCWGSFSYVDRHASEIPNIRAVVTFDGGGPSYDLRDFQWELFATKEVRAFALNIVKDLGYDVKCEADPPPVSDHVPFQLKGVPVVWPSWPRGLIGIFYHTAKDDPETLDYDKAKSWTDMEGEIAYRIATQKQLPF